VAFISARGTASGGGGVDTELFLVWRMTMMGWRWAGPWWAAPEKRKGRGVGPPAQNKEELPFFCRTFF
jgi:hypothetical protein